MTAVDEFGAGVVHLHEHGGGELLRPGVAGNADVELFGEVGHRGRLIAPLAERPERNACQLDGRQTLSLDVCDESAKSVRRGQHLVDVTADVSAFCHGRLDAPEAYRAVEIQGRWRVGRRDQRRAVGLTLFLVGAITTIPIAANILGKPSGGRLGD